MRPRVYLAGPDVFLPSPEALGAHKKEICAQHGLDAVFPLDTPPGGAPLRRGPQEPLSAFAGRIQKQNKGHIDRCDAVIANLTPFRGPSADAGTVWEVGYAAGQEKPVFGYSNDTRSFAERTLEHCDAPADARPDWRDADGMEIERFDLPDNLMIPGSLAHFVAKPEPHETRFSALSAFEDCVRIAARQLSAKGA